MRWRRAQRMPLPQQPEILMTRCLAIIDLSSTMRSMVHLTLMHVLTIKVTMHTYLTWSPYNSCLNSSWTCRNVFCNPPWRLIHSIVRHYLRCREEDPINTHAVFVLPNWPWQPWYPLVMQHFDMVDYYPSGSQLFTAPKSTDQLDARMILGPTRWPVMITKDTDTKASDGQDWNNEFRPPACRTVENATQDLAQAQDFSCWRLGTKLIEDMVAQLQVSMNEKPQIGVGEVRKRGRTVHGSCA